jgi:hypothetical protein
VCPSFIYKYVTFVSKCKNPLSFSGSPLPPLAVGVICTIEMAGPRKATSSLHRSLIKRARAHKISKSNKNIAYFGGGEWGLLSGEPTSRPGFSTRALQYLRRFAPAARSCLLDKHTIKSSTIGIQYSLRPASDLTNCEVARRYGLNLLVANLRVLSSTSPGRRSSEKKVTNSQIVQLYI